MQKQALVQVWAVTVTPEGMALTGSADKTIRMWQANGMCVQTFVGHTDCVRAIKILPDIGFVSAGNDCSIRIWAYSGECLSELRGHEGFIYSLDVLPNGDIISSAEDKTLKVWRSNQCVETLNHPGSVWSIRCLPNGDIASGCSDGKLRVWSNNQQRIADEQTLQAYEEMVAAQTIPAQTVGGVAVDKLPGVEVLSEPGTKEGQTKVVREGNEGVAYQWSSVDSRWVKIGTVVQGTGGQEKKFYDGKEYDYVFDIALDDGAPAYKLPYNRGENPYVAAQKFIDTWDLDQNFLEQIADFITQNSEAVTLGTSDNATSMNWDPYTGGNRYVPGQARQDDSAGFDPFTGGNRYVPTYNTPAQQQAATQVDLCKQGHACSKQGHACCMRCIGRI
jgi:phospholipase A-2-activating protein